MYLKNNELSDEDKPVKKFIVTLKSDTKIFKIDNIGDLQKLKLKYSCKYKEDKYVSKFIKERDQLLVEIEKLETQIDKEIQNIIENQLNIKKLEIKIDKTAKEIKVELAVEE
jgi:hypothetical protein